MRGSVLVALPIESILDEVSRCDVNSVTTRVGLIVPTGLGQAGPNVFFRPERSYPDLVVPPEYRTSLPSNA